MLGQQTNFSKNEMSGFVIAALEALDTPVALSVSISIRYGEVYMNVPDPRDYRDADSYLSDAQAVALVRKNPWIYPRRDLAAIALGKFLEAESKCKETNEVFRRRQFSFATRSIIERARQICFNILGDYDVDDVRFGPGSTLNLGGQDANLVSKLCTVPECTPLAFVEVYKTLCQVVPHMAISMGLLSRDSRSVVYGSTEPVIVAGNRFMTVPKDCRSDRAICIEPSGNMLIQKCIGSFIRRSLKDNGLDLDTAPAFHGELARIGSIDGRYATIDLSSASDTISYELVRFLLPENIFDLMNKVRSRYTSLPSGEQLFNEKFSSMGNGFTFELESLLFYSIARAVRDIHGHKDDVVSVFGDDIICSSGSAPILCETLRNVGFLINKEKTFLDGPFRESCGKDFFLGSAVRPVYLKEMPNGYLPALFYIANRVRDMALRRAFGLGCDAIFAPLWRNIVRAIPKHQRLFGPIYYGDDVLNASSQEIRFTKADGCLRIKRLVKKQLVFKKAESSDHVLACALYGISSRGVSPRGSSIKYVVRYAPYFYGEASGLSWLNTVT